MTTPHFNSLISYVRQRHQRSLRGIEEARQVSPERFDEIAEMFLGWLVNAKGPDGIAMAVDAFAQFSTEVNLAQAHYEADGSYANKSFADVYTNHYSQNETMSSYLWGIYLTNFLWAHHTELSLFFRDQFLARLPANAAIVEIAPGHGGWGAWALHMLPEARLQGYDISAASIEIATTLSGAAGVGERAVYTEKNALSLSEMPAQSADAVICSFLLEHLEQPQDLFAVVGHLLKPRGLAFLTGALTAAQVDHIYEYRRESELVLQAEQHGLRVIATLSAGPRRTLPKARFLPRSMALLVQKRVNDQF
jgi:ubiquinone/menaquinone biosynthesis C-methylase UbiE